jgi:hypothetical protein
VASLALIGVQRRFLNVATAKNRYRRGRRGEKAKKTAGARAFAQRFPSRITQISGCYNSAEFSTHWLAISSRRKHCLIF